MRRAFSIALAAAAMVPLAAQRSTIITRIDASDDVAWLETLATDPDAVREVARPFSPKAVRSRAFVRLGALATPASLTAARRVEATARNWPLLPDTVSLLDLPHPATHMGDPPTREPLALAQSGQVTYAILSLERLGGNDLFVTTSRTPSDQRAWSRPLLVPGRPPYAAKNPILTVVDETHLRFDATIPAADDREARRLFAPPKDLVPGPFSVTIDLAEVRRDTDSDGWTDLEERRLRTDPRDPDSDDDGVPDGRDIAPRHAPSPTEREDEEARVLQKAFFAAMGIHGSHDLLLVRGDSRPLQLWGSRGPVLYGVDRTAWFNELGAAPPHVIWKLTTLDRTGAEGPTALVDFSDYEGPMAAAGYTITLRKIDSEWFVVDIRMNWIS